MASNFHDVGNFHEKFGLDNVTHHGPGPREISQELADFRYQFMMEELEEWRGAVFNEDGTVRDDIDHDLAFDSLLDLAYVTFGAAQFFGYDWQAGWDRVQAANMAKVRASSAAESKRGTQLDVVKPEGWTPPDHLPDLRAQGFNV